MKFYITEPCLNGGEHLEAGTAATLTAKDAAALHQAGRGYPVADDFQTDAEKAAAAKAAEEAAAKAAEDEAKAKSEADEKAAAAKASKK